MAGWLPPLPGAVATGPCARLVAAPMRPVLNLPAWACALAALGGCAAVPPFPPGLPPLERVDTRASACPPVAGRYQAQGSAHAPDGRALGTLSVARLLDHGVAAATQFVVTGPAEGVVHIDVFAGEVPVLAWRQPRVSRAAYRALGDRAAGQTFLCQDGYLRLGLAYDAGGGRLGAQFSADWLWLRRAADGALMVLHTQGRTALVGHLLPLDRSEQVWVRFPPAGAPAPAAR